MKDFEDFKKYVHDNGKQIHSSIHQTVLESTKNQNFDEIGEEHEYYRRAWVELGFMIMLEHYHNWLNS